MRLLVLGDIHSNLEALRAVLEAARKDGFDRAASVGDVVGYGADPGPCLALLREIGSSVVMGNHDLAAVGGLPLEGFNTYAREAVEWTAQALSVEDTGFLKALPWTIREEAYVVSHGTLHQPESFHYFLTEADAADSLDILDRPVCFLGHTHLPVWARRGEEPGTLEVARDLKAPVEPGRPIVVNVGSVGQPRDGDNRAAYCLYDTEKAEAVLHRVPYDHEGAAEKILAAGLPEILATRLALGR